MCSRTCALLSAILCLVVSSLVYMIGLFMRWVSTDTHTWGLFEWCDAVNTTSTHQRQRGDREDKVKVACHSVYPGESPVYYEAVRGCALVSPVLVVVYIFVSYRSNSVGPPNIVALFYCVSAATTISLLAVNWKTDDRWKDSNPALGFGFWMACGCSGFNLVFFLLFATSRRDTPREFEPMRLCQCCCVSADPDLPTVTRRASNASCLTIDKGRQITIFHSHTSQTKIPSAIQMNPRDLSTKPLE
ncbi:hypothetical protein V1264_001171 [Littorina saxatilis]|uniref:Uncharacterized protein n=1 Tax=Littorina saxatilis TaxID=31220 RepID=A0AAN9GQK8_9CAEN